MHRSLFLLFLASLTATVHAQSYTLRYDGLDRTYLVHLPASYNGEKSLPLVFAFHGWYQTPEAFEKTTKLSEKADADTFIAVYPAGTIGSMHAWNEEQGGVDDVGFINCLLDSLENRYNIDSMRVFATGFSSGAGMCYRLAHQLSDRIAAIAPVAGCIIYEWAIPVRAVPVIQFKSKNDNYNSVGRVLEYWRQINGCEVVPDTFMTVDGADGQIWNAVNNHADIVLYSKDIGGHNWPGSATQTPATDLLWEFFSIHPWEDTPANPPPVKPENLCGLTPDGKKVYASSVYHTGTMPEKAFDLSLTTRWASEYTGEQWIMIDLGDVQKCGGVILDWATAYGKEYEILVSPDSMSWTAVFSTDQGNGGRDEIAIDVNTRYIMMLGKKAGTANGFSISEMRIVETLPFSAVQRSVLPRSHQMLVSYPNPFNPVTRIRYFNPVSGKVNLCIYNNRGERVARLINEIQEAGYHEVFYRADRNTASGFYMVRMDTETETRQLKILFIK
jgi:polyhydroxybutyrate depolymerase